MTIALRGYRVTEQIYENVNTIVYRGYRETDQLPVVIKTLKVEYPTPRDIARLQHEYRLTRDLNLPGVRQVYALENHNNSLALVAEDFGGTSLTALMQLWGENGMASNPAGLQQALAIAIQLAEALGDLHQHQIIHKDIKPLNIIVNPDTNQVKLTDFGIATRLTRESQAFTSPNVLEGTLFYVSPEQTGRMNRSIDYRTDYYSLGITLYEMLVGHPPFISDDVMELVHCHIARSPVPPHQERREIPVVLSDIILKLIAKTAEDRYQSSYGIKADLETCLEQLQATGSITPFPLAQQDLSDRFEISQKLYGREQEAALLMEAFERVSAGQSELMLVFGYSGIGKSALIHEIHKPLVLHRGYFISGKFDQFQRGIPYSSVIQAFRELVQQLLTETDAQVAVWRTKILAALGVNAQVIIDVIPTVERIIGPQPDVPDLPPAESQNRFNSVIQDFVRIFAQQDHPLVLFLDDLQWTDSATLNLIQLLTTDQTSQHLLLIGAYRDNEVSPSHPLMLILDQIQKSRATINRICLQSLSQGDLNRLSADTLRCSMAQAEPLATLIADKTHGNPFFATEFLKYVHQEGLLTFNPTERSWNWDLREIRELNVTENVVDLMTRKVQKLQSQTQEVLKLAACIGSRFDLETLAVVNQKPLSETADDLWEAVIGGLIVPIDDAYKLIGTLEQFIFRETENITPIVNYRFLHDRVQQAVYGLTGTDDLSLLHLRIGRLLLANTPDAERDDKVFDIVNHLNHSLTLITEPEERLMLARLDLQAAQKAKSATAYEAAYGYVNTGLGLLPENPWETAYDLSFQLMLTAAECAYLSEHIEAAEMLSDELLKRVQTALEKAQVYNLQVVLYRNLDRINDVIQAGRNGLKLFNIDLPTESKEIQLSLSQELQHLQASLQVKTVEELLHQPEIIAPEGRAIVSLLGNLLTPVYLSSKSLWSLTVLKTLSLSLHLGLTSSIAEAYAGYGTLLSTFQDFEAAYKYGLLSIKIAERFNDVQLKGRTRFIFAILINPWKQHLNSSFQYLTASYRDGFGLCQSICPGLDGFIGAL